MTKKHIYFIINPEAGSKKPLKWESIISTYLDHSIFEYKIFYTKKKGDATQYANEFATNEIDIVCAIGGDGTVNEVAKGLINSKTALAIIPRGSGNGLARHFSIPMDPVDAIKKVNLASIQTMDVCYINEIPFFCLAGFGFDAHIAKAFDDYGKRGLISYAWLSLKNFFTYKSKFYKLTTDQAELNIEAFLISIANASQFGNNTYIAPNAKTDDGLIDLAIIKPFPFWATPGILIKLFRRSIHTSKYYIPLQAKSIQIETQENFAHIDGEPIHLSHTIQASIIPNSLHIVY